MTILANQLLNAPAMNQLERNVIAADYQIPQENIISEMLDMRQAPQMICHELNDLPLWDQVALEKREILCREILECFDYAKS